MAQPLNLTDRAVYFESLEWLRDNVILRNNVKGPVLQLDVTVIGATATLFMDPVSHYILAFRGADGIYVLEDTTSAAFKQLLDATYKEAWPARILIGLGAQHGHGGLNTLGANKHTFHVSDFEDVAKLSLYSAKTPSFETLRKPLSLLVYMIAEGARFHLVAGEVSRIYHHQVVEADDAIQSYDKSKTLQALAKGAFPKDRLPDAVERLEKRVVELLEILGWYERANPARSPDSILKDLCAGRDLPNVQPTPAVPKPGYLARFKMICAELKLTTPQQARDLIDRCQNRAALRAAARGVISPPIGPPLNHIPSTTYNYFSQKQPKNRVSSPKTT